jgi:hypothetical protein
VLCTSPPLGYDFNLIFINSLDTDPKTVRRGIIERKFKDPDGMPRDAPWDIDRPGTQFAVACDIEIFPNVNNLVRLAFMTIYPKAPGGKEAPNKAEGAEGDFMNTTVNDGSETDESHSDEEERSEDSAAMKESDDGEVGSNAVGVDVDEGVAG